MVPSPSWPWSFRPQQRTPPSVASTHVCAAPAATALTPATTSTDGGLGRLPPPPPVPAPQQRTPPPARSAHVRSPPAARLETGQAVLLFFVRMKSSVRRKPVLDGFLPVTENRTSFSPGDANVVANGPNKAKAAGFSYPSSSPPRAVQGPAASSAISILNLPASASVRPPTVISYRPASLIGSAYVTNSFVPLVAAYVVPAPRSYPPGIVTTVCVDGPCARTASSSVCQRSLRSYAPRSRAAAPSPSPSTNGSNTVQPVGCGGSTSAIQLLRCSSCTLSSGAASMSGLPTSSGWSGRLPS